ncbi:MAG TPA: hypothetical protein VNE39_16255, partial [Planctomycetota bacterium]|nr:hypothetical protein [Planctomycetota bacterium]
MSPTLRHNGSAVDLAAAHCELGSLVRSFAGPDSLTLRCAIAFDEPTPWQDEDTVQLLLDGAVLFEGRIKASDRIASAEREHVAYTCLGPRAQADAVLFQRSIGGTLTHRVVYNCPVEEADLEAGSIALPGTTATVGQIVADILDSMAPELAGTIGDGSPGSGYAPAELDALAVVPPKLVLCAESVDGALRSVLRYAPDFGYWIDPATHQARFLDLHALEAKDLPGVGGAVIRQELRFSTDRCYSACTVFGDLELVDIAEDLTPAWDPQLEADWTSEKAALFPDTYGRVWRLFATGEPAQAGGIVLPERFVGSGEPLVTVTYAEDGITKTGTCGATVVDGTKLLLAARAREWDFAQGKYQAATVRARFTYATAHVAGRYPATGHTGTAYTRRGLVRERILLEEDRGRKTIRGTVHEVLSPTWFRVLRGVACEDELVWTVVEFNGDGILHLIATNDAATITLEEPPQDPIEAGDPFVVIVQDDTRKLYEEGTLSLLEKRAKEALERVMDECVEGVVPLAGLDWSLGLGQAISFSGTNDPEYASLAAPLVAVEHDLAHERTVLSLTTWRAGGLLSAAAAEGERRRDLDTSELRGQIARILRRHRRRRRGGLRGARGDLHELHPDGPLHGDGIWIGLDKQEVGHDGPGPVYRTVGGTGQYIEWISLDLKGHVVEA